MPAVDPGQYPAISLRAFLDQVAAPTPAPAGGSAAAVAVALAAALCAMAARKSPGSPEDRASLCGIADERRERALSLATEDALAYGRVLEAQKSVVALGAVEPTLDPALLADALSAAADVPMETVAIAAEVAVIAGGLVKDGKLGLVGDCLVAALLAAAAAEAAAGLVAINLADARAGSPGDERTERATELARDATTAAATARTAAEGRLGGT